jgi:hypothetical protein
MEITKYIRRGSAGAHDIHYAHQLKTLRYGTDEDVSDELENVFAAFTNYSAETIVGNPFFSIDRVEWKRKDGKTTVKVTGSAGAKNGGYMKVQLPEFGYQDRYHFNEITGEHVKSIEEIGCDMTGVELIQKLEMRLAEFVKSGTEQLEFDFEEEKITELRKQAESLVY